MWKKSSHTCSKKKGGSRMPARTSYLKKAIWNESKVAKRELQGLTIELEQMHFCWWCTQTCWAFILESRPWGLVVPFRRMWPEVVHFAPLRPFQCHKQSKVAFICSKWWVFLSSLSVCASAFPLECFSNSSTTAAVFIPDPWSFSAIFVEGEDLFIFLSFSILKSYISISGETFWRAPSSWWQ